MPKITSLEALAVYIGRVAIGKADIDKIYLPTTSLTIDIKISGESWDQRIDYRGAQYVQDLQKQINSLYNKFPNHLPDDPPVIKVRVRKGSNILSPDLIDVVRHALDIMGPTYITLSVLFAILCASGVTIYWRKQQRIETNKTLDIADNAISALREIAKNNSIDSVESEQPIRTLVRQINDEDTVKIGKRQKITGLMARHLVSLKTSRSTPEAFPCDGTYLLKKINLTQAKHSLILELEQDGKSLKAYTQSLPDSVAQLLLDMVKARRKRNQLPFYIELQVDVFCTKRAIKNGSILGLGQPRPGMKHYKLVALPPKTHVLPLLAYAESNLELPPSP